MRPDSVFIYGFGPYDGFEDNITVAAMEALRPELQRDCYIFDVVFNAAMFEAMFEQARPRHILGLGQTPQGERLRIESTAVNVMAERNTRPGPIDSRVAEASWPMSWGLPGGPACEVSHDAGTYVCNFSMWVAEAWARRNGAQAAFIHIPRKFDPAAAARYVESVLDAVTDGILSENGDRPPRHTP